MLEKILAAVLAVGLVLGVSACHALPGEAGGGSVSVLGRSPQCEPGARGGIWLAEANEAAVFDPPLNADAVASVDWSREGVLIYRMGRQPSGGFGLSLVEARREDGFLEVVLRERTPPPTGLVPAVITHPCIALRVPSRGLERIRVVDPAGRENDHLTLER
ncbi:protease complex subunit PrcB family protein [Arhodomonas sp. SL1]|uniref:protease complex subunit PrcB family protein n=1 Tax=Arhodomonas sp. SL1 TaxID=3425691 RepID=UPI003F884681